MDLHGLVNELLADERLLANLIGIHVVLGILLVISLALRKSFQHGVSAVIHWSELHWLHPVHERCHRVLCRILFWLTLLLMFVACAATAVYHYAGQDIRADLRAWYSELSRAHLIAASIITGKVVSVMLVAGIVFYLIRRLCALMEAHVRSRLPAPSPVDADAVPLERSVNYEQTVRRWFFMLERFTTAAVLLGGVWVAGQFAELPRLSYFAALFVRILAIVTVARLLTLSCRTLSYAIAAIGNRHLGRGKFQRYWERVARLLPFGERCFEAAVYITAASMCVRELDFIAFVASYGGKIVKCIGLFFGTRVAIELLYVFINEAFGMYDEDRPIDQKGLTLVPLLQSFCQYALYFGTGLFMLRVFEIDTTPILAGAGILGLAGGLGAQSLITDVVSGFFILFENWYLVGDIVQIGDAVGRIEAVSIRHTQVRDEQGRLFIIPNGQIKTVTNFSKGYVNAVVDIKVPASTNLATIMRDMAEAGRRLRQTRHEAMAETVVKGLIDLTPSDMVIRAVTKVQPGTHLLMQQEYRRLLKEVFDEGQAAGPQALAA
jgi:small conductance mechanosensitive channel